MTTPAIIYTDLSTYTFTASDAASDDYPLSNLMNYFSDEVWQNSSSANDRYLIIDLGSAQTINSIIIDNHNFATCMVDGSIYLTAADDINFTINLVTLMTSFPVETQDAKLFEFIETIRRYWAITFNGTMCELPHVGNIFLGKKLQFPFTYGWGYKANDPSYNTTEFINLKGMIRTSQSNPGVSIYDLNFKLLNNTFKSNFLTFLGNIKGRLRPFYFIDCNGDVKYIRFMQDYNPMAVSRYNLNDLINVKMKTLHTQNYTPVEEEIPVTINIFETEELII